MEVFRAANSTATVGGAIPMVEVLMPHGDLDELTLDGFQGQLDHVPVGSTVVVDFSKVTFCSSLSIRALVVARKRLEVAGGSIVVRNASPFVRRVFTVAGVESFLEPD